MPRHAETKILPYTADQMFGLVADVARYPEFLPWTAAARIRSRKPIEGGEVMEADLVISFKVFRESFGSRVTLLPGQRRILTEYIDGPFRHLKSVWDFTDRPEGGCEVAFTVDFEFRNAILAGVIGLVFNEAMQRVVRAFEARAKALYGAA
jgi:coenzyme Q-binding protein COQ10